MSEPISSGTMPVATQRQRRRTSRRASGRVIRVQRAAIDGVFGLPVAQHDGHVCLAEDDRALRQPLDDNRGGVDIGKTLKPQVGLEALTSFDSFTVIGTPSRRRGSKAPGFRRSGGRRRGRAQSLARRRRYGFVQRLDARDGSIARFQTKLPVRTASAVAAAPFLRVRYCRSTHGFLPLWMSRPAPTAAPRKTRPVISHKSSVSRGRVSARTASTHL